MLHFISTSSNYILMILCALYALSCFFAFLSRNVSMQRKLLKGQENYVFFFLTMCCLMLLLEKKDVRILYLCLGQIVFFKILIYIYSRFYQDCSRVIMNHTCFLLSIGLVMIARLSLEKAIKQFFIVVASCIICLVIPILIAKAHWLKRLRWFYGIIGVIFLASVFVIGVKHYGSTNWIAVGPFQLQPSEFVKLCFIFFIAATLAKTPSLRVMLITIGFAAVHVLILVLEKDLGGALLYFLLFICLCFVATGRLIYPLGGMLAGSGAAVVGYHIFSHVQTRFIAWKDPWSCIDGRGYQIAQSLFAIGTGGWFGLGLTQGRPTDIPVVDSDFIFSAIAEEFGMVFALCILLVYLSLFIHFVQIALDAEDKFYKLIAFGCSIAFLMQVFLCVGGVTKFIPSTGVTLPLISYGGSSICSTLMVFAVMQGVFILTYKDEEEELEEEEEDGSEAEAEHEPKTEAKEKKA